MKTLNIFYILIFISSISCNKKNEDSSNPQICNCPAPPVPNKLYISFWDSLNNKPYFTTSPDSTVRFYYLSNSDTNYNILYLTQVKEPNKFINKLDITSAASPSINYSVKFFYLKFKNGDIDTLNVDYSVDNVNHTIPLNKFSYNNKTPQKDSTTGIYVINK
ncbi:MAG: hypothetical protein WCO54_08980 [Bacteroidota bacterium]